MRIITLVIALLIGINAEAQVIRAEPFYVSPGEAAVVTNLLLDSFPGAAVAYSLRKLDKDYTGSAIRVRRSSDNTEQDIGFVNNYLDTASMKTFVGANDGFVVTWYNQADSSGLFGVRNMIQSIASNQPIIIKSGFIEYKNGKVSPNFASTSRMTASVFGINNFTNLSAFVVISPDSAASADISTQIIYGYALGGGDATTRGLSYGGITGLISLEKYCLYHASSATRRLGSSTYTHSAGQQLLHSIFNLSTGTSAYKNSSQITLDLVFNALTSTALAPSNSETTSTLLHLNSINGTSNGASEKYQEAIFYGNSQTTNRTAIESNINSFYSIY